MLSVVALLGGILTFISPCATPILTTYFVLIAAIFLSGFKDSETSHKRAFLISLLIFAGLGIIFMLNTYPLTQRLLIFYHLSFTKIAGGIIVYFSIFLLPKLSFPSSRKTIYLWTSSLFLLLGISLGFAWTHCLDPVLSIIISMSNIPDTAFKGLILLFIYTFGLGVPFVLSSLLLNYIFNKISWIKNNSNIIAWLARVFLVFIGISLLFTPWWIDISRIFVGLTPNAVSTQIMRFLTEAILKR